jgi:hypothetical protein
VPEIKCVCDNTCPPEYAIYDVPCTYLPQPPEFQAVGTSFLLIVVILNLVVILNMVIAIVSSTYNSFKPFRNGQYFESLNQQKALY